MNPDINYETEEENLHKLIDFLQRENQQLKELLEQAGIDYSSCVEGNAGVLSVSDQGKRILPFAITENAARHFFASLGEGWFIPGDNEVTKFSIFLAGGVGENFLITYKNLNNIVKGQFNNPIAQCIIRWILPNSTGLLSSTIKHDTGFRILSSIQKGFKGIYFKIYDSTTNGTPITIAQPQVRTCAVHKF